MHRMIVAAVCICLSPIAHGWSFKEHVQLTRIAVARLVQDPATPPQMKAWLRQVMPRTLELAQEREYLMHARVGREPAGFSGLSYWVCMPDEHALNDKGDVKVAPFNVHERLLHFIDLELFQSGDRKRGYRHDLSGKPAMQDIPRDISDPRYAQAGMLPLRIDYCYKQLVDAIRAGQLIAPTTQQSEGKDAVYWAGYLAHYVQDNTQPHHSTLDYKSQSYFADKRKAPNVHAELEYRMIDDEHDDFLDLREEFWPLFVAALDRPQPDANDDMLNGSLDVSFHSYDALPLIGLAAMHAAKQGGTPEKPVGPAAAKFDTRAFFRFRGQFRGREMSVMEMKAAQLALAVHRTERVLRAAWEEAYREK
jgi:hypothetical protein